MLQMLLSNPCIASGRFGAARAPFSLLHKGERGGLGPALRGGSRLGRPRAGFRRGQRGLRSICNAFIIRIPYIICYKRYICPF